MGHAGEPLLPRGARKALAKPVVLLKTVSQPFFTSDLRELTRWGMRLFSKVQRSGTARRNRTNSRCYYCATHLRRDRAIFKYLGRGAHETCLSSKSICFTEKGELFVPSTSYFDVVYLNPDRQAVVPCRVTVPSAKVTLHREFPAKEIPANGTDIVYDMKRGFVYLQPQSHHQGVVYCKAEAGGKSQISVKYQLLYVEVPSGPPSTTILASSNKVNGGDDISVLCTVLGEPDVEVEFRWIFPGQKDERPVTIQDTWRLIHRGLGHTTRISQSVITVEDFETIDAGYYICTAQNLRGQTTVATTVEFS